MPAEKIEILAEKVIVGYDISKSINFKSRYNEYPVT